MRKIKNVVTIAVIVLLMISFAGCAKMQSGVHDLHGSPTGRRLTSTTTS